MSPEEPAEFKPLPLLSNPHVQTLLGTLLPGPNLRSITRLVQLADGDQLVLHDSIPARWQPGDRVALLVHGLAGSHRSGNIQRLGKMLFKRGLRVARIDLRGCGHGLPLARRTYNGGCSDDVRAAALEMRRLCPESPLVLLGLSLGGNIVLKLAGEVHEHPIPGIERIAAVAPPIDLARCSDMIARPGNILYDRHFVRELLILDRKRRRYFPDEIPVRFPKNTTLKVFDELYTAPRGGYASAADYYHRASSKPLIANITTPCLILTSRDDPFIAVDAFEDLSPPPNVEVRLLKHGGHLGFLGWDGAGGVRWAERRVTEWLCG